MSQIITCPSCKSDIDLDKISQDKYKAHMEEEFEKERAEMRKKAQLFAEQKMKEQAEKWEMEMKDLKSRLEEQEKNKQKMLDNELELRKKARILEEKDKSRDLEMQRKLDDERQKLEKQMLDDAKKQSELLAAKQLEEQKKQEEEKIEKIQEEHRKKDLEMLKSQEQMKKTIDDLKRKSEQNSQQIQWDIQEDDLKEALSQAFPIDNIADVATWVKWADLIQSVNNNLWQTSWTIIWESKNTKNWTPAWIMKLKEDKLKINWNIAILVTTILPKEIKNFWMIDDVMVCLPEYAIAVSAMMRERLIAISKVETANQGKDIKMEMLYKYLSSEEFSSKISMMVDVFAQLKVWIDSERRAMEKNWKKREKDLERATFAITWVYWELESLMWQELPWAEKLVLWTWDDD